MIKNVNNTSIREHYSSVGVDEFYKNHSKTYYNPHNDVLADHIAHLIERGFIGENNSILDLCCGNGEVTQHLKQHNIVDVVGCDPYTYDIYIQETGNKCFTHSFKDILERPFDTHYDVIICSFALHLCSESMLDLMCYNLSRNCTTLIVISPNKKPNIPKPFFSVQYEYFHKRVRSKVYNAIEY
jgi:SAM-dependent methyltransferase